LTTLEWGIVFARHLGLYKNGLEPKKETTVIKFDPIQHVPIPAIIYII